jgi:flagellar biosynthesis chaperone FliJ
MAFNFSLATVLRVRTIVEEREERLLQQILQQLAATRQEIDEADSAIARCNGYRVSAVFQNSIGVQVHASYGELAQLKLHRNALEEQLRKLDQLRDVQIKAYNTARRNREMLTDMREEKREIYDADVAVRDQKALDDNFIARMGRV